MSKQKLSLQDQLLKSGLVSAAKAKTIKTEQRKQQQRRGHADDGADEAKRLAAQAQAEKADRARALNQRRDAEEARKQQLAKARQLVDKHHSVGDPNGEPYRFADGNKVKTLYVSDDMRRQLGDGRLAVARRGGGYVLVAQATAQTLRADAPELLVLWNGQADDRQRQDDYAAYPVPDDLIW